ncbi:MAG: hypothetical protein HY361_00540 [Candidatus Aenigmarchaeota archaeon]|nr:hypothetical protein [Candidatus Aenigmarchaeota archaeon]
MIYLPKQVVFASGLRQGDEICTYFCSDKNNRPILVIYLDKKDADGTKRDD